MTQHNTPPIGSPTRQQMEPGRPTFLIVGNKHVLAEIDETEGDNLNLLDLKVSTDGGKTACWRRMASTAWSSGFVAYWRETPRARSSGRQSAARRMTAARFTSPPRLRLTRSSRRNVDGQGHRTRDL